MVKALPVCLGHIRQGSRGVLDLVSNGREDYGREYGPSALTQLPPWTLFSTSVILTENITSEV